MEFSAKFLLSPLTIYAKSFILDVRLVSKYTYEFRDTTEEDLGLYPSTMAECHREKTAKSCKLFLPKNSVIDI